MRISTSKVLKGIARVYVSIIRGTPMIVQLFIIFYGIPELGRLVTGNADEQWTLSSVISLSSVYHLMLVRMLQKLSVVVLFLYLKVKQKRLIL